MHRDNDPALRLRVIEEAATSLHPVQHKPLLLQSPGGLLQSPGGFLERERWRSKHGLRQ